jgi:outer membrane protein OmpA-like peptidoglycan-associated protein
MTSLYFPNDSSVLLQRHKVTIDSINKKYGGRKVRIRLEGYTNAFASDSYNLDLSKRRVTSVRQQLDQAMDIESIGFGELEGTSWRNRRVDVFVSIKDDILEEEEIIPEVVPISEPTINKLENLEEGDVVVLEGILFLGGTSNILFESNAALIELYEYMKGHPEIRFKLIGHICCHGAEKPSKDGLNIVKNTYTLSADRAKAIFDYLVISGINPNRMKHEGRAYLEPLGKGSKYDRRVEIEILSDL